jgi:hypothetical protein
MKMPSNFFWIAALTALLAGCATKSPPPRPLGGITAVEGASTADLKDFTPARQRLFQAALEQELYNSGSGFGRGNDYTLTWTVTHVDAGSRAARIWMGGDIGMGQIVIEVKVADAKGRLIGIHETTGMTGHFHSGGDFDDVCEDAATATADLARSIVVRGG